MSETDLILRSSLQSQDILFFVLQNWVGIRSIQTTLVRHGTVISHPPLRNASLDHLASHFIVIPQEEFLLDFRRKLLGDRRHRISLEPPVCGISRWSGGAKQIAQINELKVSRTVIESWWKRDMTESLVKHPPPTRFEMLRNRSCASWGWVGLRVEGYNEFVRESGETHWPTRLNNQTLEKPSKKY